MDTAKVKHILKIVNQSISLFLVLSFVIQFLLVVMSIGAVWVINILLPITLVLVIANLGFGAFIIIQVIFNGKKEYVSAFAWMIVNQIMIFFSFIVLFSSGMTLVNF